MEVPVVAAVLLLLVAVPVAPSREAYVSGLFLPEPVLSHIIGGYGCQRQPQQEYRPVIDNYPQYQTSISPRQNQEEQPPQQMREAANIHFILCSSLLRLKAPIYSTQQLI